MEFEKQVKFDLKLSQKVYEMFYHASFQVNPKKIKKFNFFIKELRDFETVLGEKTVIKRLDEIIVHFENSIISENPSTTLEIKKEEGIDDDIVRYRFINFEISKRPSS